MAERRRRIAKEDRERIVRAFEEPEQDYLVVADTLGVNRSTARGIVARFMQENRVDERPRGGRNNVKVNAEMRQCLEAILEENPMLTLKAINRKLREELPDRPHVHVCTVAKHLDGMLYTLKLARWNITICLAISPVFGLIYHKIQSGGMTGALFQRVSGEHKRAFG